MKKVVGILHLLIVFITIMSRYLPNQYLKYSALVILFIHTHWALCDGECLVAWLYNKYIKTDSDSDDLSEILGKTKPLLLVFAFVFNLFTLNYIMKTHKISKRLIYNLILPICAAMGYKLLPSRLMVLTLALSHMLAYELNIMHLFSLLLVSCYSIKNYIS